MHIFHIKREEREQLRLTLYRLPVRQREVLRVHLLAAGHCPGIYSGIAR